MSVAILLAAIAMTWWISLTLVYHDIRWVREGAKTSDGESPGFVLTRELTRYGNGHSPEQRSDGRRTRRMIPRQFVGAPPWASAGWPLRVRSPGPRWFLQRPADIDPATAAQDALRTQTSGGSHRTRELSTSWFDAIIGAASVRWIVRVIETLLDLFARLSHWFRNNAGHLLGRLPGGLADRPGPPRVGGIVEALAPVPSAGSRAEAPGSDPPGQDGLANAGQATDLFEQATAAYQMAITPEAIRLALLALIARLEKRAPSLRYNPDQPGIPAGSCAIGPNWPPALASLADL